MAPTLFRSTVEELLNQADIRISGDRPWDIRVHDSRFYRRALIKGSLGLGEAYMDGWWDCDQLDGFFHRLLRSEINHSVANIRSLASRFWGLLKNLQTISRAFTIGSHHYDTGNELFRAMLDDYMIYSCGYWKNATNLNEAQRTKLDLCCRKLMPETGMRLLDIGCGWGGMAKYAAENYGMEVVGVTVSQEQVEYARELCKDLPVEIRFQDYRKLDEPFDRIVSIGMFEHVGHKNYATFMQVADRCLIDDGLFLLHTIGGNRSVTNTDPWIQKYIFPNSMIPSPKQVSRAAEGHFVMEDWHNFGPYYDTTLMHWLQNFEEAWPQLKEHYSERFYRMWRYYLCASAGSFRARKNNLWQIVFSKGGLRETYPSPR